MNKKANHNYKIHIIGKYGENICYSFEDNNMFKVSCFELGIENVLLDENEYNSLINKYVKEGVCDFDRSKLDLLKSRAQNLGNRLCRYYSMYIQITDDYISEKLLRAFEIENTLKRLLALNLTNEQFEEWLLTNCDEKYKNTILALKERV